MDVEWPTEPTRFTAWPFTDKVGRPLAHGLLWKVEMEADEWRGVGVGEPERPDRLHVQKQGRISRLPSQVNKRCVLIWVTEKSRWVSQGASGHGGKIHPHQSQQNGNALVPLSPKRSSVLDFRVHLNQCL